MPQGKKQASLHEEWSGAKGLAEDVRRYGHWMREEAQKRIGHLYPLVEITAEMAYDRPDLKLLVGQKLAVIAWLWARTVKSPNPAYSHVAVPLAPTFMLSTKEGKEAYVEPVVDGDEYRFTVKMGKPANAERAKNGTRLARGSFGCLLSNTPMSYSYIDDEANAGRMGIRLMAIVAEGQRRRIYLPPTNEMEEIAHKTLLTWKPDAPSRGTWASNAQGRRYGFRTFGDFFTSRQLVALTTLSDLVQEAHERVKQNALAAGTTDNGLRLDAGGTGATAYADAVAVYLAFCLDKTLSQIQLFATWQTNPDRLTQVFSRQAISMTWDFAEANPLSDAGGGFGITAESIAKVLVKLPLVSEFTSNANQNNATTVELQRRVISTDPPYYDNIGYADLSDYFYVWLRHSLKPIFPRLFATLAVPKAEELIATPYRHGSKEAAEVFFMDGMTRAMHRLAEQAHPAFPVTIYYAFKQSDSSENGTASAGWETFLDAVLKAGFPITGTWPMRTELVGSLKRS